MAIRRRRTRRLESPPQALAEVEWDRSLSVGDLVCLASDGNVPHVYEIRELHPRMLMEHELHNNPTLLARGIESGAELPSSLVIRRVRDAPGYKKTAVRHTLERKVDADKVIKVTLEQVYTVAANLLEIATALLERSGGVQPESEDE